MHPVKLNYKQQGQGSVLLILHGLFGSLDNWQSMLQKLSMHHTVFTIDLRNHGKSPHTDEFSISIMADDVIALINEKQFKTINILGHSMGGKVALEILKKQSQLIDKCIVVDIAPKAYEAAHHIYFDAMFKLPMDNIQSRKQADDEIKKHITDDVNRQFILKNLQRDKEGRFFWKINLNSIYKNYEEINKAISFDKKIDNEILFVKGDRSNYIKKEDEPEIQKYLPHAKFIEVENAGHWVHADQPEVLLKIILKYLNS